MIWNKKINAVSVNAEINFLTYFKVCGIMIKDNHILSQGKD